MYSVSMAAADTTRDWLSTEQAAARLGVKPETLYAYVSRGQLTSQRVPGSRRSRFPAAEVERLAASRRSGGRAGQLEVVIETALTWLDPSGRLAYRGWDVTEAATTASFEEVANWLWHGDRTRTAFVADPELVAAAAPAVATLADLSAVDRMRVAVTAMRPHDPLRHDRRPAAVAATGRTLLGTLVELLGPEAMDDPEAPVARRLWPIVSRRQASDDRVGLLDALLVLLADHELAASTMAVRVAASTWADPYLCVSAGLAALGGPLHGGASEEARRLLRAARQTSPAEAIGTHLARDNHVPGFGHRVYETSDPRADVLLDRLSTAGDLSEHAAGILDVMAERELPFPNIDFAIAAAAEAHDWVDDAGETVFAVARIAGWLGHAAEEYAHRLRYRTRAAYVGPAPE